MTAKRFTINNDMSLDSKVETYELSCIVDNSNKTFYFIVDSIGNVESFVERLNELNEENTMLKERRHEDINELSVIAMKYKALEKENRQLKESVYSWSKSYNRVYEEKEQLQQQIKELEKFKHFIFKSLNHIYEDKE